MSATADPLDASQRSLSESVNERAGVSVEATTPLSNAFGSTPQPRLAMQMAYSLWQTRRRVRHIKVDRVEAA